MKQLYKNKATLLKPVFIVTGRDEEIAAGCQTRSIQCLGIFQSDLRSLLGSQAVCHSVMVSGVGRYLTGGIEHSPPSPPRVQSRNNNTVNSAAGE